MPSPKIPPEIAGLIGLGGTVAVSAGGGTFLGHWAGARWGFEPWGTLAGAGIGIAAAGLAIFRAVKALDAGSGPGRPPKKLESGDDGSPKNPNLPTSGEG